MQIQYLYCTSTGYRLLLDIVICNAIFNIVFNI